MCISVIINGNYVDTVNYVNYDSGNSVCGYGRCCFWTAVSVTAAELPTAGDIPRAAKAVA